MTTLFNVIYFASCIIMIYSFLKPNGLKHDSPGHSPWVVNKIIPKALKERNKKMFGCKLLFVPLLQSYYILLYFSQGECPGLSSLSPLDSKKIKFITFSLNYKLRLLNTTSCNFQRGAKLELV